MKNTSQESLPKKQQKINKKKILKLRSVCLLGRKKSTSIAEIKIYIRLST